MDQTGIPPVRTSGSNSKSQLLTWQNLPHWQQDNHYILRYYRPASYSFKRSIASLLYLHNESVNIHTHLFGTALFLYLCFYYLPPSAPRKDYGQDLLPFTEADDIAFSFFYIGAILCLFMSSVFHTICNHSLPIARFANQLDYIGIVALIIGSFIPSVYYGFYCDLLLQKIYWAMILSLGSGCALVSLSLKFRTPKWRPFRASVFVALGLSAVFPSLHGLYIYGIQAMEWQIGLSWLVLQGLLYITGAGLYAVCPVTCFHSTTVQLTCFYICQG